MAKWTQGELTEEMQDLIDELNRQKLYSHAKLAEERFRKYGFWGGPDGRSGIRGIRRLLNKANRSTGDWPSKETK